MTTVLLVRTLTPDEFGRVALVYLVAGVTTLLDEGSLATLFVAADERDRSRLSSVLWQECLLGALLSVSVAALAYPLAAVFAQPDLPGYLLALAPLFLVTAPRRFSQALLLRDLGFRALGVVRIVSAAGFLAVVLVLAKAGLGVWSLVAALITRAFVESVGYTWAARRAFDLRAPSRRTWRTGHGRAGVTKVGERFLAYAVERVDVVVVGQALGPASLGVYDAFKRLSIGLYQQVIPAVSRLALPHLARLRAEPLALAEAYARQLRYICLVLFPAHLFQAAFAPEITVLVFGEAWVGSAGVFAAVSLLLLVRSTSGPVDALLMARGWVRRELIYTVALAGAVVGALLYAIGEGLYAAVAAVAWANLALVVPVYLWVVRPAGYVGRGAYLRAIGEPLALSAAAVALAYASTRPLGGDPGGPGDPGGRLAAGAAVTVLAFAAGLLLRYPGLRLYLAKIARGNSDAEER